MYSVCNRPCLTPREGTTNRSHTLRDINKVGEGRTEAHHEGRRSCPTRTRRGGLEEGRMGSRRTWPQICCSENYWGCWVALDECEYDPRTARPTQGIVVDADEDLVALCN